jgi:hypothetical protein
MSNQTPLIKIEPILPKKNYPAGLMDVLAVEIRKSLMTQVKPLLQSAQQKRIQNWKTRPTFNGLYRRPNKDEFHLVMNLSGSKQAKERWTWVSLGTNREGKIKARRATIMKFKRYKAATAPGNVYGRYHGRSWNKTVYYKKEVKASSIKAREFETHIIDENTKEVFKLIQKAVDNAVRSYD